MMLMSDDDKHSRKQTKRGYRRPGATGGSTANSPEHSAERMIRLQIFGKHLRDWRLHAGLTQDQLAAKLGVDGSYVSSLENGRRSMSSPNLRDYAKALGVELEVFTKSWLKYADPHAHAGLYGDNSDQTDGLLRELADVIKIANSKRRKRLN